MSKVNLLYRNLMKATLENAPVACQINPELFDPDIVHHVYPKPVAIELARKYCGECPIQMQCREFGIVSGAEAMMWGGLTPEEIKQVSRRFLRNAAKNA